MVDQLVVTITVALGDVIVSQAQFAAHNNYRAHEMSIVIDSVESDDPDALWVFRGYHFIPDIEKVGRTGSRFTPLSALRQDRSA